MTPEQQRIAIAEACGWTWTNSECDPTVCWRSKDGNETLYDLPDYPNDLNAMHEAEKVLRNNQFYFVNYLMELWKVVNPHVEYTGSLGYLGFEYVRATAAQRAEAFLRTIGKWTE